MKPFAWTAAPVEYAYELASLGLPLCAGPRSASAVLLTPEAAEGMTDAELESAFAGGVLTDGRTVRALEDRGLAPLAGLQARPLAAGALVDRLTAPADCAPDRPSSDWRCRHYFDSAGPYALEGFSSSARVLSLYCDEAGAELGASCVLTENSLGGRVAVIGSGLWAPAVSSRLQSRLLEAADWASRGRLPVLPETPAQVVLVPRATPDGELRAVFVLNPTIDELPPLRLRLRGTGSSRAAWLRPEADSRELTLDSAPDGPLVTLPSLPPWSAGWLLAGQPPASLAEDSGPR